MNFLGPAFQAQTLKQTYSTVKKNQQNMHEKLRFGRCKLMFSFSGQNIQNVWQTGDFTARFACKGK